MSHRIQQMAKMEGGSLIPPQAVAVQEGHQEMLKQTHIKVDDRYFAIDPNLDFEASTILCEDRVYTSDQTPSATVPISFTIQPQFNVFRSLSESRFVFTIKCAYTDGETPPLFIPKPYWSQLFVRDLTININNVSCGDQHSRTASYAGFAKILLTQGNLKTASVNANISYILQEANPTQATLTIQASHFACDDTRALQEGIINVDTLVGEDWLTSYNNVLMYMVGGGYANNIGDRSLYISPTSGSTNQQNFVPIELTYRPQDGIFLQPKLLPPGVNLNYIFSLSTLGTWCNGYITYYGTYQALDRIQAGQFSFNPDTLATASFSVLKAQYYERQYTITQTGLKAYQSLIMRQPLYFSCMTSNTLLYPVAPTQQSVQLTNLFSGRIPNIIMVGLLNQAPSGLAYQPAGTGNIYPFKTYSPLPAVSDQAIYAGPGLPSTLAPADCISAVQLTVNGRTYPHLWSSNMQPYSTQDLSQWYEQYRQCALISRISGRGDDAPNSNYDTMYKYDNPILTKAEFSSVATFCCFNIRRNGTLMNCSGDKEVGGIDMLVSINGTSHPSAQLMIVGINTDSLATITDGGSTTSFVF